ncbi:MAG TPA: DUF4012 domain-containing protein [Candidatus Gracilibacteria bacterium]|nr:DUF4012 domain-containing protein [Candidatus Gracilibacteria bacterium]
MKLSFQPPFFRRSRPFYQDYHFYLKLFLGIFLSLVLFWILKIASPFAMWWTKLPSLMGCLGPKHYLIVLQNNSEARPTGGFISAYGELDAYCVWYGLKFQDSYQVPDPENPIDPPSPLKEIFQTDPFYAGWVFRDGNWDPDYASSAEQVSQFYRTAFPHKKTPDGVIAMDFNVIKTLFKHIGSLKWENREINADNFFHWSQFYSKNIDLHSENELSQRKGFMQELLPLMLKKVVKNVGSYDDLIWKIRNLLDEKHILLFFRNGHWQKIAQKYQWAGEITPQTNEQVLHINVANIGGRKADRYLLTNYQNTISFTNDGKAKAELDLEFHHTGTKGLYSDFYQAYVRTYLPMGIANLKHWGDNKKDFVIEAEHNLVSIGTLIHLQPGEKAYLHFTYDLPRSDNWPQYQFRLIPMPGHNGENWRIVLRSPQLDNFWQGDSDWKINESTAIFEGRIFRDKILRAEILNDVTPPVIVWQKFLAENLIELAWSEELDPSTLKIENFSLSNLDTEADIPLQKLQFDPEKNLLWIKSANLNWQEKQRFRLKIQNLRDLNGNYLENNPKNLTLIMRYIP